MAKIRLAALFLGLMMFAEFIQAKAFEVETTPRFARIETVVGEALKRHPGSKILLVFDIDNTLLALNQDLGSEQWFLWQAELFQKSEHNPALVARSMGDILKVQDSLYALSATHPVDPAMAKALAAWRNAGVNIIALTSRSLTARDATLRELTRNGLTLRSGQLGVGFSEPFLPYDPAHPEAVNLSQADLVSFSLRAPRDVVFQNGIFLTDGQHKGIMLRTLLAKTHAAIDTIVFVDDRRQHLDGVQAAFSDSKLAVYPIQYTQTAAHNAAFAQGDKREVIAQWCQFSEVLKVVFYKEIRREDLPFSTCVTGHSR